MNNYEYFPVGTTMVRVDKDTGDACILRVDGYSERWRRIKEPEKYPKRVTTNRVPTNEDFPKAFLQANFELTANGEVRFDHILSEYLSYWQTNDHKLLTTSMLEKEIIRVFPSAMKNEKPPHGTVCYIGIQCKENPL